MKVLKCSYFLPVCFVAALFALSQVSCSGNELSTSDVQSCWEVAKYIHDWISQHGTDESKMSKVDVKFLHNFVRCVYDVYKLYKNTDWTAVQKIISAQTLDFVKAVVPHMGAQGLHLASSYLFYQTLQLHARVESLNIDSDSYRKEFEYIRAFKIRPTMERIERDIVPLVRQLGSSNPQEPTENAIVELRHHNAELKALLRNVYKSYLVAKDTQQASFGFGVGALFLCAGSRTLAQPALAVLSCSSLVTSALIYVSSTSTLEQLVALAQEAEMLSNEI